MSSLKNLYQYVTKPSSNALYRAEQVRELDRITIEEEGVPGIELMSKAGQAVFDVMMECWGNVEHLWVFCGTGNNGGDGYIVARLARQQGIDVSLIQVGNAEQLKGDALTAYQLAKDEQIMLIPFDQSALSQLPRPDLIVDALLGTGLTGEVRGDFVTAIEAINASPSPVLSIDIPSGLCSDTGVILGGAVHANMTMTFIGVKQGLLTGEGPEYCGELRFADLDVPEVVYAQVSHRCRRIMFDDVVKALPARRRSAHKGSFGHVLVVGGDYGMGGAAAMAAEAAARVGAGLVSVVTRAAHCNAILSRHPECMVSAVEEGESILPLLDKATVVVAGPGIGCERWGQLLMAQVIASGLPLVVDADGLNYLSALAGEPVDEQQPTLKRDSWILTPHPGEASRLLGVTTTELQQNRFDSVTAIQQKYGGVAILKGCGTLIRGEDDMISLADVGNPGMASGGMGDVLSGIVGGLVAQGLPLTQAATIGVWLHGSAADRAVKVEGERGLMATDLMPHIRKLANTTINSE